MKAKKVIDLMFQWLPYIVYIFLASFVILKFVFIFFLNAAFTPEFIFHLTPLFLLPGMNNLQLLFVSVAVVLIDTYLHMTTDRKHLKYSFIPTALMISGIGIAAAITPVTMDYLTHYVLFAVLLFTMLIDHRKLLMLSTQKTLSWSPRREPTRLTTEPQSKGVFFISKTPKDQEVKKVLQMEKRKEKTAVAEKQSREVKRPVKRRPDLENIVDPFYADILKNVGVTTVESLAKQEPDMLHAKIDQYLFANLEKYMGNEQIKKMITDTADVEKQWIEKAKTVVTKE